MSGHTIEISIRGKWQTIPALKIGDKSIAVRGDWLKIASIEAEEWLETATEDPELCVKMLRDRQSHNLRADLFTFAQKLPDAKPRYSYPMVWDSVAAIPIPSFQQWWESLPQESRKNFRRSQKRGVVVTVRELDDVLIQGLVDLNNDSPVRQGTRYTHFGKTFEQVKKDQQAFLDRSDLICAWYGDELVGFLRLVYRGDVASILQLLPKASHSDKRPANALLTKAVELCAEKGITHLAYGMFNYGNKRVSSLREFKTRNGFEEILMPRYYVPLTIKGAVAMKLNLHRGLIGILPHWFIAMGGAARTKWYRMKIFLCRCSSMLERPNRIRQTERSNPPAGSNS